MPTATVQPPPSTKGDGSHSWNPPEPAVLGAMLSGYEVLSLLGRGGMGAVYCAVQRALDRPVALKLLPIELSSRGGFAERFSREARAMAKLNHPNIVSVYDFGTTLEGHLYFAMEFVEGTTLADLIHGPGLNESQALTLAGEVCLALAYAHDRGVIHRDVKPTNILVDTAGHARVADFGLARLMDPSDVQPGHTATGAIMGTPDYMAPEQKRGMNVDHRADIYSLGVMLYEMLCGRTPQGAFAPPSEITGCDAGLDRIVARAMQPQPERRYQSTGEMKTDVDTVRTRTQTPRMIPIRRRRRILWTGAALLTVLTVVGVRSWLWPVPGQKPVTTATPPAAALTVTTAADELDAPGTKGAGLSLREAVRDAPTGGTVRFSPDTFRGRAADTIRLSESRGEIQLNHDIHIDGSGIPGGVAVDGGEGSNRLFYVSSTASVSLSGLTISGGNGRDVRRIRRGGAIYSDGQLRVTDCLFTKNLSYQGGGALYSGGPLTLVRCTFLNNSSSRMGGAVNVAGIGSSLSATHCTFTGNIASFPGGGAVTCQNGASPVEFIHCTISGNETRGAGTEGSGLRLTAGCRLVNCIVTGNRGSGAEPDDVVGDIVEEGTNILSGDAGLLPLADNGGAVPTMALRPGSPALDAASLVTGLETDARGLARTRDGNGDGIARPDIGAFEVQTP